MFWLSGGGEEKFVDILSHFNSSLVCQ